MIPAVTSKVLIIGASFSGLHLVHYIKDNHQLYNVKQLEITLVDPKDYFEYTPGILHALTGSNSYSKISDLIPNMVGNLHYDPIKTDKENNVVTDVDIETVNCQVNIVRGLLMGFQPCTKKAFLCVNDDNNKESSSDTNEYISCIDYDILIICAGLPYTNPIRPSQQSLHVLPNNNNQAITSGLNYYNRKVEIDEFKNKLLLSQTILIAGGGLVGVELAAEIAIRMKYFTSNSKQQKIKRKIILITRSSALVDTLPTQAGVYVYDWLIKHGELYLKCALTDCLSYKNMKYYFYLATYLLIYV